MRRLLIGPLVGALAALTAIGGAPAHESPGYLALGDSIAFGLGATNPGSDGYVALVHRALQESEPYRDRGLELRNLAFPGARSEDLLLEGGQLDQAIAEIRERAEDADSGDEVEVITFAVGGNDLLALAQAGSPCASEPLGQACLQRFNAVLTTYQANVTQVLQGLRTEAPAAQIIAVTLYNPFSGTGSQVEAPADLAIALLNGAMLAAARSPDVQAKVADPFPLFRGNAREYIAGDGLHPSDAGHKAIAETVLAALEGRAPALAVPSGTPLPSGVPLALAPPLPTPVEAASSASQLPSDSDAGGDGAINVGLLLAILIPAAAAGLVVIGGAYWLARGQP